MIRLIFSLLLLLFSHLFAEINNEENCSQTGVIGHSDGELAYSRFIEDLVRANEIRSIVDVGYGDCPSLQHIFGDDVRYTGFDIVANAQESLPAYKLPPADLLICTDVLQHLSNEEIAYFLKQTSKFTHCLITCDVSPQAQATGLDLTKHPFNVDGIKIFTYETDRGLKQVLYVKNHLNDRTVLLTILARNKAHVLPKFLKCIENLDYEKKNIGIYINTNNNCDDTLEVLMNWVKNHQKDYRFIDFDIHEVSESMPTDPHDWTPTRFNVLGQIRNKSLKKTQEYELDYYFVVDCDNFINPCTLRELIKKDRPIIAPMLTNICENRSFYSNFFAATTESGYYADHPDYWKILLRSDVGVFKVPVVHCSYLIRSACIDQLNYLDGSDDYEFVIFSRNARESHVDQYVCNEQDFGYLLNWGEKNVTLEEEKALIAEWLPEN